MSKGWEGEAGDFFKAGVQSAAKKRAVNPSPRNKVNAQDHVIPKPDNSVQGQINQMFADGLFSYSDETRARNREQARHTPVSKPRKAIDRSVGSKPRKTINKSMGSTNKGVGKAGGKGSKQRAKSLNGGYKKDIPLASRGAYRDHGNVDTRYGRMVTTDEEKKFASAAKDYDDAVVRNNKSSEDNRRKGRKRV